MKATTLLIVGALLLGCLTTSAIAAPIGDQQQQPDDSVDVNQLIEEVKTTASEVGTSAYVLYKYIVSLALQCTVKHLEGGAGCKSLVQIFSYFLDNNRKRSCYPKINQALNLLASSEREAKMSWNQAHRMM